MASCSNSSSALVTSSKKNHYDVFVTFRGEDTRNNFTDFLFDALETKNISVFRDNTNLQQGESIGPELLRAIEGSQVYVAVFSRNYASSTWCMKELEKICECVHGSKKHVLPVFYDVDPSEVRKQSGIYFEAFANHEQRYQQDFEMVSRWREALKQVGSISGWDLHDKPQAGEIKKIVQKIMNILDCKSSLVSKDLVGINSRIEVLQNHLLLDSVDDVRAIGIWGMGGIGKTTLAMDLYGKISHQFGASCFIDDVNKICRSHDGPLRAQKQILLQTVGIEHHQVCNRYSASDLIRRRLCREKALLILDNVEQVEQLEKIGVHREWLGAGSRIVITSRDEHMLNEYGVDGVYKVPLLNQAESYTLFCRKAFKVEKIIMSNYQNLADEILDYAKGLPLAITVLGSFLFGRNVTEWKSELNRLKESPDKDVMNVLQLSFDGLREETEKEIFLDIACFFNGYYEPYVKNILNCCGFHADIGLRVLIDKSLISIIDDEYIEMHSLLEKLGRKIVQNSSSKEPRKWSRLWSVKQFYNVKMENMEKHVEAIVLNVDYEEVDKEMNMIAEHLSKMSNLRLLIIKYSEDMSGSPSRQNISVSPSYLSNKLRYVEWNDYPFKHLPTSFHPTELVELILMYSDIKQLWKNKKYLPNLRRMDLEGCKKLVKIEDFGEFPNLEWLNLKGCINLVELDPSIGLLTKLVYLNLRYCKNQVKKIVFGGLLNLEWLNLERCEKLVELDPSIGLLRKLVYLNLENCKNLVSIPNNIFGLSSLEYLNMHGCSKAFKNGSTSSVFKYLLPSLHSLDCLRNVVISFCNLSQVPDAIECLCSLERLNLGGNDFVRLPSLRKLSKLVYLNLEHCTLLESLPQLPSPTTTGRERDENDHFQISGLIIFNCPKLGERERCSSMTFSWMTQFIQEYQQSNHAYLDRLQIVTPGSEIPSWINNQSMGNSILIDFSPIMHDNNNNIIGFLCCAVFAMAPYCGWFSVSYNMRLVFECTDRINFLHIMDVPVTLSLVTTKLSHLWIIYFPRESYRHRDIGKIHFQIFEDGKFVRGEGLGMEVKSCGYRWVCKKDLQEFNLTMMNHKNSLAPKCKILAIEDETQPQPQPEQESFISQVITTSQREKSRTSISATETEVFVEVQDSPVADEGDLEAVNSTTEEAIQTDITTSNVETDSPVEVANESVTESGVDQIVAEDEQQSHTDIGKEEVAAATPTDIDAVEPGPVITTSAPDPQEGEDDNVEAVPENNENDAGQSGDLSPEGSLNKDVTEEVQEGQTPVAEQVEEVAIASETNSISNSNEQTEGSSEGFNFSRPMIILFLSLPVLKLLGMWVRR